MQMICISAPFVRLKLGPRGAPSSEIRANSRNSWKGLRGGDFFPLGTGRLPEIAEPAFLDGTIREFQRDLRRPASLGLDHVFHNAYGAGNSVNHGFAEITRPGFRYFGFAHGIESMQNRNNMSRSRVEPVRLVKRLQRALR